MPTTALQTVVAVVGIDIGKNTFHVVGLDSRGAIVLRQKWSRSQVEARFANMPPWLLRQDAVDLLYVVIAAALLLWLVWTFLE